MKTKARKTNTDVVECVSVGCDAAEAEVDAKVDAACDPIDVGPFFEDIGCDPIDLSIPTTETGSDAIRPEVTDVGTQILVSKTDKFTHMEIQKSKSVGVATQEVAMVEAATETAGSVADCASQAEVTTKEKGTSCKVRSGFVSSK